MKTHVFVCLLTIAAGAYGAEHAKDMPAKRDDRSDRTSLQTQSSFDRFVEARVRPLLLKRSYGKAHRAVKETQETGALPGMDEELRKLAADIKDLEHFWVNVERKVRGLKPGQRLRLMGKDAELLSFEDESLRCQTGGGEISVMLRDMRPDDVFDLVKADCLKDEQMASAAALFLICEAHDDADELLRLVKEVAPVMDIAQHKGLLCGRPVTGANPAESATERSAQDHDQDQTKHTTTNPEEQTRDCVIEGKGWQSIVLGCEAATVLQILGQPDNDDPNWLVYRKRIGIDVVVRNEKAVEIRFNKGFQRKLLSGAGIGTAREFIFAAYGDPVETRDVEKADGLFDDRVLYKLPQASKILYADCGVLFWLDRKGKVSQFVVFPPRHSVPSPPINIPEQLKRKVSLTRPYPASYAGAPTDRISVQYAVIEVLKQVQVPYDWNRSFRNTNPACRRWIKPEIRDLTCEQALRAILGPAGLGYVIDAGRIVLVRK